MTKNSQTIAINGIHHITAVASSAAENFRFYTRVLGLRLVKKTVNFDDPYTYHLYYGDHAGHPGTILTFFPWEQLPQGRTGAGMVSAIAFAVPRSSMDYWRRHLTAKRIAHKATTRFEDPVIHFDDPHGLPLELVGVRPSPEQGDGDDGPRAQTAISGFHSATLLLNRIHTTQTILADGMGMTFNRREGQRYRFSMQDPQAPGHLLDVVVDSSAPQARPGGGTVHHIAFRTRDSREQQLWRSQLQDQGLAVTGVRDRKYFQSVYFHEPGGVLFEIATDPPGFAVDEAPRHLGTDLKLPPQYEPIRTEIEAQLPSLESSEFDHAFIPPGPQTDTAETIVALHGTGGDEHDLIPLVQQISPAASIISPRGKVLEHGMPRFFQRLAEGVFDEHEVRLRAYELADFLTVAAARYQRPTSGLVAVGYSNGANIAAAIMLLQPGLFTRAVLLRPMLPLQSADIPDLNGMPVLITRGSFDTIIPSDSTDMLVEQLEQAGAQVTVVQMNAGHEITASDVETARAWLSETEETTAECEAHAC